MTKYKLFPIDWSGDYPRIPYSEFGSIVANVGLSLNCGSGNWIIFGFADDENWVHNTTNGLQEFGPNCIDPYDLQPCDREGNRKFAIGRLCE